MEEEDPVVQEALSQNLYIYQYPVRPANRDWKDIKVVNASVKPRNKMVRLEVGLGHVHWWTLNYSAPRHQTVSTDRESAGEYVRALVAGPPEDEADIAPTQVTLAAGTAERNSLLGLYLFTQTFVIDSTEGSAAVRLPPAEVLENHRSVAKFNPKTGWELIIPPDVAFEMKYPKLFSDKNFILGGLAQRLFNEMLIGENLPKGKERNSTRFRIIRHHDEPKTSLQQCTEAKKTVIERDTKINPLPVAGKGLGM
uniref:Uncharacterized protein n=1 Tax=Heliothis virescens TaxID=7102 RepID=A0A2A4J628_HELVI